MARFRFALYDNPTLQFEKQLRLLQDARRHFRKPPMRDVERLRELATA
jgi:hypothetical protein